MLEGEIRDIDLIGRLVELWRERFTGAIRFENDGVIKILYLKEGDVLSASTNDRADSVDEILMRAGKVSREHVKQALTKRKENETLGDALLTLGFITRKELTWGRRMQVISVLRSAGEWQAGTFTIVADYLPKREEGTIFPLPQVIVELIVTDNDRAKYERLLESGSVVFSKAPDFDESFRRLGLNEEADTVTAQVDGERTASEVASASGQETFNAFKLLHALSLLGLLKKEPGIPKTTFSGIGVPDAADAWAMATVTPVPVDEPAVEPAVEVSVATPTLDLPAIDIAAAVPPEPPPEPPPKPPELKPLPEGPVPTPPARPSFSGTRTSTQTRRPLSVPAKKKSGGGRFALVVTLMVLAVVVALGYFGFTWWTGRETASTAIAAPVAVAPPAATTAAEAVATPRSTAGEAPATQTVELVPPTVTETAPAPAPATPASGSLKERYDSMARDFARAPAGNFTVQFAIVCEPSNVTNAMRTGGANVWFIPIAVKERSCYRLFWGRYDTREAAQRALPQLPAGLRESRPAVVSIPR